MASAFDSYVSLDKQKRDDTIRDALPLVYSIARRVANATAMETLEVGDLVQAGVIGLYKAMDKFDERRGVAFATYAGHYVRGSMLDELHKYHRVPRGVREKQSKLRRAYDALTQQLVRTPEDEEVAAYLDISKATLDQWLMETGWTSVWSVEELEAEGSLHVTDEDLFANPAQSYDAKERKAALMESIQRLSMKEQQVLYAYYQEELTLKEIAYVVGLSESQISRIHSKAILRLRGMLSRDKSTVIDT